MRNVACVLRVYPLLFVYCRVGVVVDASSQHRRLVVGNARVDSGVARAHLTATLLRETHARVLCYVVALRLQQRALAWRTRLYSNAVTFDEYCLQQLVS